MWRGSQASAGKGNGCLGSSLALFMILLVLASAISASSVAGLGGSKALSVSSPSKGDLLFDSTFTLAIKEPKPTDIQVTTHTLPDGSVKFTYTFTAGADIATYKMPIYFDVSEYRQDGERIYIDYGTYYFDYSDVIKAGFKTEFGETERIGNKTRITLLISGFESYHVGDKVVIDPVVGYVTNQFALFSSSSHCTLENGTMVTTYTAVDQNNYVAWGEVASTVWKNMSIRNLGRLDAGGALVCYNNIAYVAQQDNTDGLDIHVFSLNLNGSGSIITDFDTGIAVGAFYHTPNMDVNGSGHIAMCVFERANTFVCLHTTNPEDVSAWTAPTAATTDAGLTLTYSWGSSAMAANDSMFVMMEPATVPQAATLYMYNLTTNTISTASPLVKIAGAAKIAMARNPNVWNGVYIIYYNGTTADLEILNSTSPIPVKINDTVVTTTTHEIFVAPNGSITAFYVSGVGNQGCFKNSSNQGSTWSAETCYATDVYAVGHWQYRTEKQAYGGKQNKNLTFIAYINTSTTEVDVFFLGVAAPAAPVVGNTSVTINSPLNITYLNSSVTLNWTANETVLSYVNCSYDLDTSGTSSSIYTVTANGTNQTTLAGLTEGQHHINVTCNGSTAGVNTTTYFIITYTNVTNQTYNVTAIETSSQYFSITVNKTSIVTSVGANLSYNSVNYPATLITETATQFTYGAAVIAPLVALNNTAISYNWTYSYSDGALVNVYHVANQTQNVYWGYYITLANSTAYNVLEGDPITYYANTYIYGGAATIQPYVTVSSTTAMANSSLNYWIAVMQAPEIVSDATLNQTYYANFSLNVTYGSTSYLRYYDYLGVVNVSNMFLFMCNSTGTPTINFTFYDQSNITAIQATFSISAVLTNAINTSFTRNYSGSIGTAAYNYTLCIFPPFGSGYLYTNQISYSNGYQSKTYEIHDLFINGSMLTIPLYLGNSSYKFTYIQLFDAHGTPQNGKVIEIYQWYPANSTYLSVSKTTTDDNGRTGAFLLWQDTYYKFVALKQDNSIIKIFVPATFIPCSNSETTCTYNLYLNSTTPDFTSVLGAYGVCSFSNTTKYLTCTVCSQSSNITADLLVIRTGSLSNLTMCSNVTTIGGGTCGYVTCFLNTTNTLSYSLSAVSGTATAILDTGFINQITRSAAALITAYGWIFAWGLVIFCLLMGVANPVIGLALCVVALIILSLITLMNPAMMAGNAPPILGLVIIAAVMIWKMPKN